MGAKNQPQTCPILMSFSRKIRIIGLVNCGGVRQDTHGRVEKENKQFILISLLINIHVNWETPHCHTLTASAAVSYKGSSEAGADTL